MSRMLTRGAKRRGFDRLSDEVVLRIFSFVQHDDFRSLRLTCRRFNEISKEPELWKKVDLGFPRALWQIGQVLKCVLPAIPSVVVEELKITGFHEVPMYNDRETGPRMRTSRALYSQRPLRERVTVSTRVFELIKESCPGLKTLVIRNCWLDLDHDSHVNLPNGLEKLEFHDCRIPHARRSWLGQMTVDDDLQQLENLKTLKFERCYSVETEFGRHLRAFPAIKNVSIRGSIVQLQYGDGFPPTAWHQLKVLDVSGTGRYAAWIYELILKDATDCTITHFYMEKCKLMPRIINDHPRFTFVSVAGSTSETDAFHEIARWSALPSLRELNASGCRLRRAERQQLISTRTDVVFNLRARFEPSRRMEF